LSSEQTYDKKIEDLATNIGLVAYVSGVRPSALFEWNDPDEWMDRLAFDLSVSELVFRVLIDLKQLP
jgi:hypothetical protein